MKAIVQNALGEPADVLKQVDVQDGRDPSSGEVLVDVVLAPVHHGDLRLIRSQPSIPADIGHVRRGSEAVGIVRALGAGVADQTRIAVGDRVIVFPTAGSWAESVIVPASALIPVPNEVSDEVAAQLLINAVTARMVLRSLNRSASADALRKGVVLVTGAGTVVARLLIHLLDQQGLTCIGLARSTTSAERIAAELNGASIIATESADWRDGVTMLASGRKIVGVLDCVAGTLIGDVASLLEDDAVIISYGALGGARFGIDALDMVGRQVVIRGVVFTRWFSELSPEEQAADVSWAFEVARNLSSLFRTSRIYDLARFSEAVAAVETPGRDGFVFLRP